SQPSPRITDTGIFEEDRYFDVEVEYAKASPEDVLVRITVTNRGRETARLDVLPQFWFRNTWSWGTPEGMKPVVKPELRAVYSESPYGPHIEGTEPFHGRMQIWLDNAQALLFCDNETNTQVLYGVPNKTSYPKDSFHPYICKDQRSAASPARAG